MAGSIALAGVLLKLGSFGLYLVVPYVRGTILVLYLVLRV